MKSEAGEIRSRADSEGRQAIARVAARDDDNDDVMTTGLSLSEEKEASIRSSQELAYRLAEMPSSTTWPRINSLLQDI